MTKKVTNLTDWEEDSFINDKINAKKLNKLRKPKFISSCGVLSCFRSKNYVKNLYRKISNTFKSYISTSTSQTSPYLTHEVNKLSPMVEKNVMKPKSSLLNKERSLSSFSVDNFEQKSDFNTLHYKTNHTLFHQELNYISPLISETPENMFHQSDLIPDHSSATQTYSLVTQQSISQQQQQQQPFKINLMEEKRCNSRLLRHFTETLEQNHNIDVGSKYDKSLSCLKMDDYVDGDEVNHIRGSSKQVLQHYNDNIDGNQSENTKNEESSVDNYRSMHHFIESRLHKLVETIFSYENSFHITPELDFSNNHEQFGSRLSCSIKSYSTERQQESQENKDSYQIQNFDKDIKHWLTDRNYKSVKKSTKLCRSSPLQNLDKFRTHSENSTPCSSVNTYDLLQLADVSDTFDIRDIKKYVYDESLSGGHHDDGHRNVGHFTNISEASGNGCIGFPLIDQTHDQDNYPLGCSVYPEINNMPYVHSGYYPCIPPPAQPTLLLDNINPTWSNNLNQELVLPFLTSPLFNTPSSVNWTNLSTTVNPYKYDKNTYFYPVYPYYYPVEQFSAARHPYFPIQPYQSLNTTNHNSHSASKQREISNAHKTNDYSKRNKA
ncbi:unnamed protein product [Heterobilharzia americana]|nr:unnamed protein product [Heterobilharzia americana]